VKKRFRVRSGQAPSRLDREAFRERFERSFADPRFDAERTALGRIEAIVATTGGPRRR
jgi:hypothetical protein